MNRTSRLGLILSLDSFARTPTKPGQIYSTRSNAGEKPPIMSKAEQRDRTPIAGCRGAPHPKQNHDGRVLKGTHRDETEQRLAELALLIGSWERGSVKAGPLSIWSTYDAAQSVLTAPATISEGARWRPRSVMFVSSRGVPATARLFCFHPFLTLVD